VTKARKVALITQCLFRLTSWPRPTFDSAMLAIPSPARSALAPRGHVGRPSLLLFLSRAVFARREGGKGATSWPSRGPRSPRPRPRRRRRVGAGRRLHQLVRKGLAHLSVDFLRPPRPRSGAIDSNVRQKSPVRLAVSLPCVAPGRTAASTQGHERTHQPALARERERAAAAPAGGGRGGRKKATAGRASAWPGGWRARRADARQERQLGRDISSCGRCVRFRPPSRTWARRRRRASSTCESRDSLDKALRHPEPNAAQSGSSHPLILSQGGKIGAILASSLGEGNFFPTANRRIETSGKCQGDSLPPTHLYTVARRVLVDLGQLWTKDEITLVLHNLRLYDEARPIP